MVIEPVVNDLQAGIARLPRHGGGVDNVTLLKEAEDLVELRGILFAPMRDPPDGPLQNHADRGK